jgi:cytochrome c oxidase cbb3-type subunit 4
MLKSVRDIAASMNGIGIYPVISLLLFFAFFIVLLYYVKKMDKAKVDELSRIPLEEDDPSGGNISINNLKQA